MSIKIKMQFFFHMAGINDLMTALSSNVELRDQLASATTPQAAVEAAAAAGYKVTAQELLEAYKNKMAAMSDSELTNVAGGKNDSNYNN
jgi:predicted ribosomally synthesized peptide with nif11-like leader